MDMTMNAHEERALEAILVLACLAGLSEAVPDLWGPEPELDTDDERALDELGPDLVQRILEAGEES